MKRHKPKLSQAALTLTNALQVAETFNGMAIILTTEAANRMVGTMKVEEIPMFTFSGAGEGVFVVNFADTEKAKEAAP